MPDPNEVLAYKAMSAFFGAIATTIIGIDALLPERRTTANFIRVLDELLADLPNRFKGKAIEGRVQVLRKNLEIDMDKVRRIAERFERTRSDSTDEDDS